jgi:hypothetical protein
MTTTTTDLSYPIGRFTMPDTVTADVRRDAIDAIAALPQRMRDAVAGLSDSQLDTPYRPEGWTVRQLVHHVPDSHVNAFVRLKLALTEDSPTVKPYDERVWATLPDSRLPVAPSLALLDGLHARWAALLRALPPTDFARTFTHPEYPGTVLTIDWHTLQYCWHCRHHVAHITSLRQRQGW